MQDWHPPGTGPSLCLRQHYGIPLSFVFAFSFWRQVQLFLILQGIWGWKLILDYFYDSLGML